MTPIEAMDHLVRKGSKKKWEPDTSPLRLPTAKEMKEALTLRRARMLRPAGKRHGKDFAKSLSLYAGVCAAARCEIRDLQRGPQGDNKEQAKLSVIAETKSNWASVAPKPATKKESKE